MLLQSEKSVYFIMVMLITLSIKEFLVEKLTSKCDLKKQRAWKIASKKATKAGQMALTQADRNNLKQCVHVKQLSLGLLTTSKKRVWNEKATCVEIEGSGQKIYQLLNNTKLHPIKVNTKSCLFI